MTLRPRYACLAAVALVVALLSGCDSDDGTVHTVSKRDTGSADIGTTDVQDVSTEDATPDTGETPDAGDDISECAQSETDCDSVCVDTDSDRNHCGACGNACGQGELCDRGQCAVSCSPGLVACNGTCVDPNNNPDYCGASGDCQGPNSGATCADGQVCSNGACGVACQPGEVICDGKCVDPATDRDYCGASGDCVDANAGDACSEGQVCNDGSCAVSCPTGQLECNGACVDPQADRTYCGASGDCQGPNAGTTCGNGQVCANGACALSCPDDRVECNGSCVDPDSDRVYCGANGDCQGPNAGAACGSGEVCSNGACALSCPQGQIQCDGTCVDPQTDRAYCGASADCQGPNAGATCGNGEVCSSGACALSCPANLVECNGTCVDPDNDRNYCGASLDCQGPNSGAVCGSGELCSSGSCVVSCPSGQVDCSGVCVDTNTDRAHCGACGNACGSSEVCNAGACELSCPSGQTDCSGTCVDTANDRANCGACGLACGSGEVCNAGACELSCPTGQIACNSVCVNPDTDRNYCGASGDCQGINGGDICGAGEICNSGVCELSCQSGLTDCNGLCVDLDNDEDNCGSCGNACSTNGLCQNGSCGGYFPGTTLLTQSQQEQINVWMGNSLQTWTLCYRKTSHGASASTFHSRCDNQGPTVTVAQLSTGHLIGGYASQSWNGSAGYIGDTSSFLFSLTNSFKHAYPGNHGGPHWMYSHASYGPTFGGGHDFQINNSINGGYCNLGHTYTCRTSSYGTTACRNDFCGSYSGWSINELEVWVRD